MSSGWHHETATAPEECEFCGKKTPRFLEGHRLGFFEEYAGNEQVISRERRETYAEYVDRCAEYGNTPDTEEEWRHERESSYHRYTVKTWDGVSYRKLRYGHFCTLRCAYSFAESAYAYGLRLHSTKQQK